MLINNYITTALRHIYRQKLFSIINVIGLAIGLACVMLIALFVRNELNYDKFWSKVDDIYRVQSTLTPPGREPAQIAGTPGPVFHLIKNYFPEIEYAARIARERPTLIINGEAFLEDVSFADPDIINIFDFKVIAGDIAASINDTSSLILNQSIATKYFPDNSPIGKVISINFSEYKRDYQIGAIIEDLPTNSQLNITALVAIDEQAWSGDSIFSNMFAFKSQLYYAVNTGSGNAALNARMNDFVDSVFPVPPFAGPGAKASSIISLNSLNVKDLHLNSPGVGEHRDPGEMSTVVIFSAVAGLILTIACINFINLSTARATHRAKEVSLRKVVGASRKQLIMQFLGEAILLTSFAFLMALTIVELALPAYNDILGGQLLIDYNSSDFLVLSTAALFIGILSGTYPAFVLSSFRPAQTLKANRSVETRASIKFRTALVVFQFAVSIGLFVSTAVVYGQMQYTKNINLGYSPENLLIIHDLNREETSTQLTTLVEELRRIPEVSEVTWSRFFPGLDDDNSRSVRTQDTPKGTSSSIGHRRLGFNFFKTYEIQLLAGREYDIARDQEVSTAAIRSGTATAKSVIINQAAISQLGFKNAQGAIGSVLYKGVGRDAEELEAEQIIIGVVPNIHFNSLKSTIRAEIYDLRIDSADAISVRFTGNPISIAEAARELWQQNIATIPFDHDFAEDILAEQYAAEQGQGIMFATFSSLAILVACLGLFGLASITTERRTKEIGLRKIFGAEVFQIVRLFVWQFSKPVMIANLIAWPLSFHIMSRWLESFAYRMDGIIIIAFCLVAGLTAFIIAWATVAGNSYAVARQNPIKALRYE